MLLIRYINKKVKELLSILYSSLYVLTNPNFILKHNDIDIEIDKGPYCFDLTYQSQVIHPTTLVCFSKFQ